MKSYASVDRIEGKFAVCEVELLTVEQSNSEEFATYETAIIDVLLQEIPADFGEVNERDILIVEHDGENVTAVYCKDEEEKARRIKLLKELMGW